MALPLSRQRGIVYDIVSSNLLQDQHFVGLLSRDFDTFAAGVGLPEACRPNIAPDQLRSHRAELLALMAGTFVRLGNELIKCSPEEILKTAQRLPDSSCSIGRPAVPVLDYTMNNL